MRQRGGPEGPQDQDLQEEARGLCRGWHDELQSVLWSIRTTATKPTGETPFFLVYGAEAVLPHEVKHRSARVLAFDETQQDATRGMDLVLGEERRCKAALRAARYQQALRRYHCHQANGRDSILPRLWS